MGNERTGDDSRSLGKGDNVDENRDTYASPVTGSLLDTRYGSMVVQEIEDQAIRTVAGIDGGFTTMRQAAQAVLDMLYTAMALGAFEDFIPKTASKHEFELADMPA